MTGNVISPAPTLHHPLSHGALRRDSSPFRGAEGWVEVWGVYALVYHDADTVVFLSPVRGGVLDAPWLRDCRGGVGADGRRSRLRRRLMRRVRLCLLPNVCDFAGTARAPLVRRSELSSSVIRRRGVGDAAAYGRFVYFTLRHTTCGYRPRTISNGHPTFSVHQRRAGVEARPYGLCETYPGACRVTGAPASSLDQRRAGVEDKPLRCEWECVSEQQALGVQKGPVCGPVLFALRPFRAVRFRGTPPGRLRS